VVLALSLIVLLPARTAAWGSKGHQIIARIATDRLSSNARQSVAGLLQPGETLETVSTWADQIKLERKETASWHMVLIGVKYSKYDPYRDCPKGSVCIIEAIENQISILKNPKSAPAKRTEALKFLVHLIGDLHQPFHVTTNDKNPDDGATRLKVSFLNGRPTNLHAVWDDDITNYALRQSHQSVPEYASQLSTRAGKGAITYTPGDVTKWAEETHRLAWNAYLSSGKFMYPEGGKVWNLDDRYYAENKVVVENRMVEAGKRLAALLNYIFAQTK
jgi:nuclease S1